MCCASSVATQIRQDAFLPKLMLTLKQVGAKLTQKDVKGLTLESLCRLAQVRHPLPLPPCRLFA